jgi:ABC-type nickel/cobalt efflux system permease component RcnA
MNKKDEKILIDAANRGIPVFVLTAKDKVSYETLVNYHHSCVQEGCGEEHLDNIMLRATEFKEWQENNFEMVKTPD